MNEIDKLAINFLVSKFKEGLATLKEGGFDEASLHDYTEKATSIILEDTKNDLWKHCVELNKKKHEDIQVTTSYLSE